jgi:hypothetical protein
MKWYNYIFCFLAGLFIANTIPHFVQGISGNSFPSPFSNPPGKGLSLPVTNVYWSLANLIAGYLFYRFGKVSKDNWWSIIIFFVAFAFMSIWLSLTFVEKMRA